MVIPQRTQSTLTPIERPNQLLKYYALSEPSKLTPKGQTGPTLLCMRLHLFRISSRKLPERCCFWPLSDVCSVCCIQTGLSAWGCSTSSQFPPPTTTTSTFSLTSLTSRYTAPLRSRAVLLPPMRATKTLRCLLRCARLVPCLRRHCAQESCSRWRRQIAIEDIHSEMYLLLLNLLLGRCWEQLTFRSGGSMRQSAEEGRKGTWVFSRAWGVEMIKIM